MTYCGLDCCKDCEMLEKCGGCEKCGGHPFGGSCIAERNKDFLKLKDALVGEINGLGVEGLKVGDLNLLYGGYVNLEYTLENGQKVKFLNENDVYLGNQIERDGFERCFGVVASEKFILVCEYGCGGADPEIVIFKRR